MDLPSGTIQGAQLKTDRGLDFYAYRGVPYAAAPVGDLRFRVRQSFRPSGGEFARSTHDLLFTGAAGSARMGWRPRRHRRRRGVPSITQRHGRRIRRLLIYKRLHDAGERTQTVQLLFNLPSIERNCVRVRNWPISATFAVIMRRNNKIVNLI